MNCAVAYLKSTAEPTKNSLESSLFDYSDDVRKNFFEECFLNMERYVSDKIKFEENDENTHWITRLNLEPNQEHTDLLSKINNLKTEDQSNREKYFKIREAQTKNGNTAD
jgi:hypothetical protein